MKSYFTVFCFLMFFLPSIFSTSFGQQSEQAKYHEKNPAIVSQTNHDPNFIKKNPFTKEKMTGRQSSIQPGDRDYLQRTNCKYLIFTGTQLIRIMQVFTI